MAGAVPDLPDLVPGAPSIKNLVQSPLMLRRHLGSRRWTTKPKMNSSATVRIGEPVVSSLRIDPEALKATKAGFTRVADKVENQDQSNASKLTEIT
ncbi:hypothetical protein OG563_23285 [Nocardia vinacea]|uniref:FXSXX-COOH protein n=1 Tax=Nocardia vinacea TaxID=96468 RepID=A0ABZ1YG74_9NOCA|nr:hypothetical protein [Nocardia vinacea]